MELTWRGSAGTVQYRIEMARGDGPMQAIGRSQTNSSAYRIEDVPEDVPVRFRVSACDARTGVCSWPTPTSTEQELRELYELAVEPVTEIRAYRLSPERAYLEWSPAAYASYYVVEMRWKEGQSEEIERLDPQSLNEWFDGLQPEREYSFRVRACREGGCADYSTDVPLGRTATLLPPAGLQVIRRDPAVAVLSWQAGERVDEYRIEMAMGRTGEFVQIGTARKRTKYMVRDLEPAASYRFRVRSCLHAEGPCSRYTPIFHTAPDP